MGAGPMALAARSMRSRAPGANSQRQAPSQAWCRGSARHPTSPHTCSARRRARARGSLARGYRARGRDYLPRRGAHPSPRLPQLERGSTPRRRAAGSRRLFHPQTSTRAGKEFRSLQTDPQPPAASHNLYLSLLPRRRTGRRHKEEEKKKLPPLLVPSSGLRPEEAEEGAHLPSSSSGFGGPGRAGQQGASRWPREKR